MSLSEAARSAGRTKIIRNMAENAPKVRLDRIEHMVGSVRSRDMMNGARMMMSPEVIIVWIDPLYAFFNASGTVCPFRRNPR